MLRATQLIEQLHQIDLLPRTELVFYLAFASFAHIVPIENVDAIRLSEF